ncbi:MAG: glycine cleavage system protein GcvH [Micavibrio aeruginosavorus]|uniref:Glycine cleavage system H protein n=1 Tax=Micavibrio aeruginosavorus TaxID=349221 RepID=A0A2W5A9F7_9BACT|nr:MAG: glycine cleavage system protein GcvH [Micavibrio aeruginosavorus]
MADIKYTNDHEWIKVEGDTALVGITTYARHALGDLVYLELPETGRKLAKGENFAVIESVKAASEIYAPVSGEIVEVNEALQDNLEDLKEDLSKGWIIRIRLDDIAQAEGLMDKGAYDEFTESLS